MRDWAPALRQHLATLRLPPERESELVDELAQHLDEYFEELVARGIPEGEALDLTRRELERASFLAEQQDASRVPSRAASLARGHGRLMLLEDSRHAWRRLTARPEAPLLCAALLALGIGLTTAMFSVVDSLLIRPAPFPDGDRIVGMGLRDPSPDIADAWMATGLFEDVEAVRPVAFRTAADAAPWRGAFVTAGVFEMLGVRPLRGRALSVDDGLPGGNEAVLLSETIWRSTFGADPDLLGRRIELNDESLIVVGIMPEAFRFPEPATIVWRTFDPVRDPSARLGITRIVGRLKPGVPMVDAERRTGTIARELSRLGENRLGAPPLTAVGRPQEFDDFTRRALWLLLGGVLLVFVVLCANVASLLLAQLSGRTRELGICTALGASRARLLRQSAIEHALIATAGALAGIALARGLTSIVPELFLGRTLNPIDLDTRALAAATIVGAGSVLLSGLLPAWLGTRTNAAEAVRGVRQAGTDTPAARLATRGLLVAEIALACSLLAGSALLARSFANLANADRGLRMDGLVHVNVRGIEDAFFTSREANALGTAAIRAEVASWPEVEAVALAREIPPTWDTGGVFLGAPGPAAPRLPATATQAEIQAWINALRSGSTQTDMYRVDPDFFQLYGIRILRGRALAAGDSDRDAVVGERLANELWPGANPIGQSFTVGRNAGYRVVGLAAEIRVPTIDREQDRPELYLPLGSNSRTLRLSLRCRASCPDFADMQSRLQTVHPALGARVITTAENTYLAHLRLPRAVAQVGGVFAVVAVLTSAGGLFSVMTYAVGRRRREFGIRAALGATAGQMRGLVFREGLTLVAAGVAIGTLGGWLVARSLAAFQYGVATADPAAWIAVLATVTVTSIAASWRPAQQAMRVDPVKLLREE